MYGWGKSDKTPSILDFGFWVLELFFNFFNRHNYLYMLIIE